MSLIMVKDLTFSYDTVYENIFEHVSFQLDTDWRLGFIGRNGRGKTTFLNLLLGKYQYKGSITASVSFDYFPFEVEQPECDTLSIIKNTIAPYTKWEEEMELCLKASEGNYLEGDKLSPTIDFFKGHDIQPSEVDKEEHDMLSPGIDAIEKHGKLRQGSDTIEEHDKLLPGIDAIKEHNNLPPGNDAMKVHNKLTLEVNPLEEYGRLLDLYQAHDGYIIEEMIEKELAKLGVDSSVLTRPFSTLSFGERTKIMLAALFLKKNNFLLIDEPTNHLDMEGRETLAEYLQSKKGFILVSHDRAFLDQCIDHVLSINKADIEVQKGNYTTWNYNKQLQDQYELEKNEQLKKDITILAEAAKRAKGWSDQVEASKIGTHTFDRGAVGHKAAKIMKRAKSIESRKLEAIEEKKGLLQNIEKSEPLKMNLLSFPNKSLLEARELSLYYDDRLIAANINFILQSGDRIAIQGKNGSGKSTLFQLLLGEQISHTGDYRVAPGLKISYVSQDTSYLSGTLKDFAVMNGLDETIFKTVLRQLDFSRGQFEKDIRDFSGGQKKKVLLAKSLSEASHVFIWDEPLNFIDVFSRVQIEELILRYQPTIVFVEHDRMFTERIANKVIRLEV